MILSFVVSFFKAIEDQPRPGCSRDVPAAKQFKRKIRLLVEDMEEVYAWAAALCEELRKKEGEEEEKGPMIRAPVERRQRSYFS